MYGNELSDRKKQILKAIIEAHIVGGEPVGSKYLMQSIACSSATIRNEMAELEEMGYLSSRILRQVECQVKPDTGFMWTR